MTECWTYFPSKVVWENSPEAAAAESWQTAKMTGSGQLKKKIISFYLFLPVIYFYPSTLIIHKYFSPKHYILTCLDYHAE